MTKQFIIIAFCLIFGFIFILLSSFFKGAKTYDMVCDELSSKSEIELLEKNYYGLETCPNEKLVIADVFEEILLVAFILQILMIITEKRFSVKKHFTYALFGICFLLLLFGFEQILLNLFPSISYQGWQDAGWTINHESTLMRDFRDFFQRPSALIFYIVSTILFSIISVLGPFFSGLLTRKIKKPLIKITTLIALALIIQVLVYLATFPIGLWVVFNYTM